MRPPAPGHGFPLIKRKVPAGRPRPSILPSAALGLEPMGGPTGRLNLAQGCIARSSGRAASECGRNLCFSEGGPSVFLVTCYTNSLLHKEPFLTGKGEASLRSRNLALSWGSLSDLIWRVPGRHRSGPLATYAAF